MPNLNLPPESFRRHDESADETFYTFPRFVEHIDADAIAAVTQIYRAYFPPRASLLDLMSSWVSHLPEEVEYARVVGVGMNLEELAKNPRLTEFRVQDLNCFPELPFDANEFDGAAICVSIQYLTQPVEVLRQVGRVLKRNAPLVITFSNRCFPTKAVTIWQTLGDQEHLKLVDAYLRATEIFSDIEMFQHAPPHGDPLYAVIGRKISDC